MTAIANEPDELEDDQNRELSLEEIDRLNAEALERKVLLFVRSELAQRAEIMRQAAAELEANPGRSESQQYMSKIEVDVLKRWAGTLGADDYSLRKRIKAEFGLDLL